MIQDVIDYWHATVDNTNPNDRKVILFDEPHPYIQRFFVQSEDKELIERCKQMRKLGIPSLK